MAFSVSMLSDLGRAPTFKCSAVQLTVVQGNEVECTAVHYTARCKVQCSTMKCTALHCSVVDCSAEWFSHVIWSFHVPASSKFPELYSAMYIQLMHPALLHCMCQIIWESKSFSVLQSLMQRWIPTQTKHCKARAPILMHALVMYTAQHTVLL